jgi:hypothetical protein
MCIHPAGTVVCTPRRQPHSRPTPTPAQPTCERLAELGVDGAARDRLEALQLARRGDVVALRTTQRHAVHRGPARSADAGVEQWPALAAPHTPCARAGRTQPPAPSAPASAAHTRHQRTRGPLRSATNTHTHTCALAHLHDDVDGCDGQDGQRKPARGHADDHQHCKEPVGVRGRSATQGRGCVCVCTVCVMAAIGTARHARLCVAELSRPPGAAAAAAAAAASATGTPPRLPPAAHVFVHKRTRTWQSS